ncbi:MAG: (Fe-S)-binding protein [Anaerolineales bacterium]|nr:(Fe-S)-binding protein [Anaerolineales bacterium]
MGEVTKLESLSPHGWALTIASQRRGLIEWNTDSVGALYHCADCGLCRANCVTDQPLPNAIVAARNQVVESGLAPRPLYTLADALAHWGNPYAEQMPVQPTGAGEVALFVGDEAMYRWPAALEAATRLLEIIGIKPVLVGRGRNNGYLASSLGFAAVAHDLIAATIAEVAAVGARRLLVLAPADLYAFGDLAGERLQLKLPEGVVLEAVTDVLDNALQAGQLALRHAEQLAAWAYVDPTHSARIGRSGDAPRRLGAALGGEPLELFWRRERAHPSGATALRFSLPHMAYLLAQARLQDAQRQGAQIVVTEAPGDLAILSEVAPRLGMRVQGLYELLASQLV